MLIMSKLQKNFRNICIKAVMFIASAAGLLSLSGAETKSAELPKNLSNAEKIGFIKEIILKNMDQTPDYIDLNTFDCDDIKYANSLSIWQ